MLHYITVVLNKSLMHTCPQPYNIHNHANVHSYITLHNNFSRCEPKWIPVQFINCVCHCRIRSCCCSGTRNWCEPIGPCRCIICYGPDPNDSENDAEDDSNDHNDNVENDDTVKNCKDGIWKYVCCKSPVKEVKLCISSPEPAARSGSSSPDPEMPLLDSISVEIQTGSTKYGSDGGKITVWWVIFRGADIKLGLL